MLEPYPWRSHFSAHTFDFFKPHGHPLYPVVDGPATTLWFTKAADACAAQLYRQVQSLLGSQQQAKAADIKQEQQQQQPMVPQDAQLEHAAQQQQQYVGGLLQQVDYFISHAPYNKIVRKIFARVVLHDMLRWVEKLSELLIDDRNIPAVGEWCVTQLSAAAPPICGL